MPTASSCISLIVISVLPEELPFNLNAQGSSSVCPVISKTEVLKDSTLKECGGTAVEIQFHWHQKIQLQCDPWFR